MPNGTVLVIDTIGRKNDAEFPVVFQSDVKGGTGYLVADDTARDAIPASFREIGMVVKVLDSVSNGNAETDYQLQGGIGNGDYVQYQGVGNFIPLSQKGAVDGVAPLGSDGYIDAAYIKNLFLNDSFVVADEAAMLALTTVTGNVVVQEDLGKVWFKRNNADPASIGDFYELTTAGVVVSVNGQIGVVSITIDTLLNTGPDAAANTTNFNTAVAASPHATSVNSSISTINSTLTAYGIRITDLENVAPSVASVNGLTGSVEIDFDTLLTFGDSAAQFVTATGNAIHDDLSGEIDALTDKPVPVGDDLVIIEDSAASFGKKKVAISTIWAATGAYWNSGGDTTLTADVNIKSDGTKTIDLGEIPTPLQGLGVIVDNHIQFVHYKNLTNNVWEIFRISHLTSNTAAAGFGGTFNMALHNDGGAAPIALGFEAKWISAVAGSEETEVTMRSYKAGTPIDFFKYSTTLDKIGLIAGNVEIGDDSLAGTTRIIQAAGSAADVGIQLLVKGAQTLTMAVTGTSALASRTWFTHQGGTFTGSSGIQYLNKQSVTINQSGTAGYSAIEVDVTETAVGSGVKSLINLNVGGASKFRVDNDGMIYYKIRLSDITDSATPSIDCLDNPSVKTFWSTAESAPALSVSNFGEELLISIKKTTAGDSTITIDGTGLKFIDMNNKALPATSVDIILSDTTNYFFEISLSDSGTTDGGSNVILVIAK